MSPDPSGAPGPVPVAGLASSRGPLASILALTGGEVVNKAARFLAAIVLARTLTLAEFGAVNVGIAAAGLVLMATTLGLPDIGAADVAVDRARARGIAGRVLAGRLVALAALGIPVAIVLLLAHAAETNLVLVAAAMAVGLALSADWLLRGLERMRPLAWANATGGLCVLLGTLLVVEASGSAVAALAAFACAEFVVSGLTWWFSGVGWPRRPTSVQLRHAVRRSWPVGLAAFIVYSYYANLDTIILSIARSAAEAGLYSAPYRTFLAINVVGTFAAYAYLPLVARGDDDRLFEGLRGLFAYGLIALGTSEVAGDLVLGLLFGERFESVGTAFIILCIAVPWYVVAFPVGYSLIAQDKNRGFLRGAAAAGGLNLALNLALIPPFGIDGAAAATSIALIAGSLVWLRSSHRERELVSAGFVPLALAATLGGVCASAVSAASAPIGSATALLGVLVGATVIRQR